MMNWLLPWYFAVVCVQGPQGTLVPGVIGPAHHLEAAQIAAMIYRYELGCETGEIVRRPRWVTAAPPLMLHPRLWVNVQWVNGEDFSAATERYDIHWVEEVPR